MDSKLKNLVCPNCHNPFFKSEDHLSFKLAADLRAEMKMTRQKATVHNCHSKMGNLEQEIKSLVHEKESLLNILVSIKKRLGEIDLEYDQKQQEYSSCCSTVTTAELAYIASLAETPELYRKLKM